MARENGGGLVVAGAGKEREKGCIWRAAVKYCKMLLRASSWAPSAWIPWKNWQLPGLYKMKLTFAGLGSTETEKGGWRMLQTKPEPSSPDLGQQVHNSTVNDGSISNNSESRADVFLSQQSWSPPSGDLSAALALLTELELPAAFNLRKPQAKQTWHITFPPLISTLKLKGGK